MAIISNCTFKPKLVCVSYRVFQPHYKDNKTFWNTQIKTDVLPVSSRQRQDEKCFNYVFPFTLGYPPLKGKR